MIRKKILMAVVPLLVISGVGAAVSLDRIRTVFDGGEKSMTLDISNDNKQLPYLTQAWTGNENQEKIITGPAIATPPIQHLKPDAKSMVRLSTTPGISKLPQGGESLPYFNLRGISPRSERASILQIALQIKIKLFYHLTAIKTRPNEVWWDQLILNKVSDRHRIENPTPCYVTIVDLGGSKKQAEEGESETVMLSPRSEQTVKPANYNTSYLPYINDYGGHPALSFICNGSRYSVKKEK